jgi:hypothetical protein
LHKSPKDDKSCSEKSHLASQVDANTRQRDLRIEMADRESDPAQKLNIGGMAQVKASLSGMPVPDKTQFARQIVLNMTRQYKLHHAGPDIGEQPN